MIMRLLRFLRNRSFVQLLLAFFFNVLLFSIAYWLVWQYNPDYFIVNQELNLTPLADLRVLQALSSPYDQPGIESSQFRGLESLSDVSNELIEEVTRLNGEIVLLRQELLRTEEEWDKAYKESTSVMEANFSEYYESSLQPLLDTEARLDSRIGEIEAQLAAPTPPVDFEEEASELPSLIQERAELMVDIAQRKYELLTDYFDRREEFFAEGDLEGLDEITQRRDATEQRLSIAESRYYELRGEIYGSWLQMRQERVDVLKFPDFLYFSFTVSGGSAFGDILPNHTVPRMLVIIQLFINLVTIGAIVAGIVDLIRPNEVRDTNKSS